MLGSARFLINFMLNFENIIFARTLFILLSNLYILVRNLLIFVCILFMAFHAKKFKIYRYFTGNLSVFYP